MVQNISLEVAKPEGKARQLTEKQRAFVGNLIAGMNPSAAYRAAYDCPNANAQTVATKAYETARLDYVAEYRKAMEARKDSAIIRSSLSDREKVLNKLRTWMDSELPVHPSVVRSAELLGKAAGLFKGVPDDPGSGDTSAASIEARLKRRLVELLGNDVPAEYNVVDGTTQDDITTDEYDVLDGDDETN